MWYCLPDSLSLLVYNPETSSRVTLALLGTVFQTALTVLARHVQNQSRITRMRRICSSLIIVFMWIDMRLYGALIFTDFHYSMDYLRIISCWGISSAVRAQEKIRKKTKTKYI